MEAVMVHSKSVSDWQPGQCGGIAEDSQEAGTRSTNHRVSPTHYYLSCGLDGGSKVGSSEENFGNKSPLPQKYAYGKLDRQAQSSDTQKCIHDW